MFMICMMSAGNKMMTTHSCRGFRPAPPPSSPLSFPLFSNCAAPPLLRGRVGDREAQTTTASATLLGHLIHLLLPLPSFLLSFLVVSCLHHHLFSFPMPPSCCLSWEGGIRSSPIITSFSLCPLTSVIGCRLIASQGFTHGTTDPPPLTLARLLRLLLFSSFLPPSLLLQFFYPPCISLSLSLWLTQSSMIAWMGFSLPKVLHLVHDDDSSNAGIHSPLTFLSISVIQCTGRALCTYTQPIGKASSQCCWAKVLDAWERAGGELHCSRAIVVLW